MLPKHLTLNIERRLETTIYKDTMETPWLRNKYATAYCLPEVVLAEVLGYCKRAKDHGYLCGPCFPLVMAAEQSVVSFIVKSGLSLGHPGVIVTLATRIQFVL